MEFKKLEIKQEGSWLKRLIKSQHFKRTLLFILAGAVLGLLFTVVSNYSNLNEVNPKDYYSNIFTGAFIGFFLTNSPCARGRC